MKGRLLRRWWWAAVFLAALAGLLQPGQPLDLQAFGDLGQQVLTGRLADAYAGSFTQAGPLQLVLSRVLLIGGHDGTPPAPTRIAVDVALLLGALAVARGRPIREVAVAILTLLWLFGPVPWNGHPVEIAVPVLWAYGMVLTGRDHRPAAAVALGLAVLIAPFAVLGFPCLLAVDRPGRAMRVALAAAGVALLGCLPFLLSGQFGVFGHVWPVQPGTLPHLLGLRTVTWATRLLQAVVVAGGCGLVAHLSRRWPVALATAALLRVATDPLVFEYYWLPVAVGVVLLVAVGPPRWWTVAGGYVAVLAAAIDRPVLGALAGLTLILVAEMPRYQGLHPGNRRETNRR